MNKSELVKAMAEESGLSQKDAEKALNSFVNQVSIALSNKDKVQLVGFGTFETRERAERDGVNPATGEKIKIAAATAPAFKPGKALKEIVNK
ncbi:MAG: HU family DNA-binding protein [Bacilli bacterium]|nr:HU family DNA-binding protein [Bacilli bacterium]